MSTRAATPDKLRAPVPLFARLSLRLGGFYFLYFATVGAFAPYFSLYLQSLHFDPRQIGLLIAVTSGAKVVAPYLWGWLGDRIGKRLLIARLAGILALLACAGLGLAREFLWFLPMLLLFSFFWNATLPQLEVATLQHLGEQRTRYGHIRLWGSIGFILAASLLGAWLTGDAIRALPWVVTALMAAIVLNTLGLTEAPPAAHGSAQGSMLTLLRSPSLLAFLFGCFCMQASHGPYYVFFSIYLEDLGYSRAWVGPFWSLGVVAEIAVFLWMPKLLPRYGAERLFLASLIAAVLRWLLTAAMAHSMPMLLLAQIMHAATFGLFHAAAIELVHRQFPSAMQGRGQALYGSVSFGLGGAAGAILAGYLWEPWSGGSVFALGAALALLGFCVAAPLLLRQPK